ncbi:hypothetical protein HNY73_011188 [Argiope bruennichi]|uniref:Uncharacterized protein n=1 Tax=Argiope bruennichi TaxID=94029 RepID=A0A8T0F9K8_ARGBR|nr:hypothetical protein HNY73_011188 [Argiope bruennichi]
MRGLVTSFAGAPNKGKLKRNPMCEPVTDTPSDKRLTFLKQLVKWVKFKQISWESRFGQYRSMAGDQYHISVRQIYETESKLSHKLKLASRITGAITVNIFDDNDENNDDGKEPINLILCDISLEESDIDKIEDTLPIIAYLAAVFGDGLVTLALLVLILRSETKSLLSNYCKGKNDKEKEWMRTPDLVCIQINHRENSLTLRRRLTTFACPHVEEDLPYTFDDIFFALASHMPEAHSPFSYRQ